MKRLALDVCSLDDHSSSVCGILVASGLDRPFHDRLLGRLRRRGPDGLGFWTDGRTHLAHTRLAVVGLGEHGAEPVENATHVLAFNGEIYNFLDIARRVTAKGDKTHFGSDAEVLLEAWSLWGEVVLDDLYGFWAFAIYDKRARRLSLVRDQLGVKPLYYWRTESGGLAAGSSLASVLSAVGRVPGLNYGAMSEYVRYQITFGDATFFDGVKKVPPGSVLTYSIDDHRISAHRREDIFTPSGQEIPDEAWIAETVKIVESVCLDSTIGDTPFTTLCSGGLDSSAVTRITEPEVAYHCNFSDPECNETQYAKAAVDGTKVRLMVTNAQEDFDIVERLTDVVADFDELSVGSVILPLDDILDQVRRRYKVVLVGSGGDELFGGYARYHVALGRCPQESYRALWERVRDLPPLLRFEICHRKGDARYYRFFDEVCADDGFRQAIEAAGMTVTDKILGFDRRYFLGGLLNIDDKMCGRHGIEGRPSLLHQRLVRRVREVESAKILDPSLSLKWLGRRILKPFLPTTIVERQDKMGFTTPIGAFINRSSSRIREQVTSSRFRDLYDLRRLNFTTESKFSREVFGLLLLDLWLNRYASGTLL